MITSGLTAQTTASDAAVVVLTVPTGYGNFDSVTVINEGTIVGFFSIDNGNTWARLPASASLTIDRAPVLGLQVKRVAGGSNLTGIWGFAWTNR